MLVLSSMSFPTTDTTGKHLGNRGSSRNQSGLSCLTLGLAADRLFHVSVEVSRVEGLPAEVVGSAATLPAILAAAGFVELHSPSGVTLAIPNQAYYYYLRQAKKVHQKFGQWGPG